MYLPYLRGKQYELVALRELSFLMGQNAQKVSPIIEPVKNSSTFKSTLRELYLKGVNFTVIINPQEGTFRNTTEILDVVQAVLGAYQNYQVGIIMNGRVNVATILDLLRDRAVPPPGITFIHESPYDDIQDILAQFAQYFNVKYNVVNLGKVNRRYPRNFGAVTLVELDDYFSSQNKNSAYLEIDSSEFSQEHLFYEADGYVGFSDYLTIGDNYSETGFLPYAVAIHISYAAGDTIRVKHFVSDSNDDTSDIAGKFEEALNKLIAWCDETGFSTSAIVVYRDLHANGHFPGLGTIKKLSVINHIELILSLI